MTEAIEPALDPDGMQLLQQKLGDLLNWTVPDVVESVGPFTPNAFDAFDELRRFVISACRERIAGYSEHEIAVLTSGARDDPDGKALIDAWHRFLSGEIDKLDRNKNRWWSCGFGHPDHAADIEYWSKMPEFSIEELLFLSLGVEPGHLGKEFMNSLMGARHGDLDKQLQFLQRRNAQLLRVFIRGEYPRPVRAKHFLEWVDQVGFEVHRDFLAQLREIHHPTSAFRQLAPTDRGLDLQPDKREIDTMAQLFTAIAIDQFGYDPTARRSPIPREIAEILAKLGLEISDETVRKYLRRGARFLPEGWKDD